MYEKKIKTHFKTIFCPYPCLHFLTIQAGQILLDSCRHYQLEWISSNLCHILLCPFHQSVNIKNDRSAEVIWFNKSNNENERDKWDLTGLYLARKVEWGPGLHAHQSDQSCCYCLLARASWEIQIKFLIPNISMGSTQSRGYRWVKNRIRYVSLYNTQNIKTKLGLKSWCTSQLTKLFLRKKKKL